MMKTILRTMGVMIFSLLVTGAFAQQGGMRNMDPEASAQRSIDQMKEIIKINSDEEAKVKEVFLKYAKERQTIMQSMGEGGDREQMRAKMTEMTTKQNAELEKILGKERFETYNKKIQELRQNRVRG
ncbi:MAG TPA: hypothetical protein VMW76_03640 [Bacteroidales bacterium]|nr:hypothetical protein [Bacteroidales bacterium]